MGTAGLLFASLIAGAPAALFGGSAPAPEEPRAPAGERVGLFADTSFRRGFLLSYPSTAKGRAVEKVLEGLEAGAEPAWRLCPWATRVSLAGAERIRLPGGGVAYEDETKRVEFGGGAGGGPDLVLELRAGAEYQGRVRAAGEAWPHLLVEADSTRVVPLDRLERLELEADLRLRSFEDRTGGRADPSLHAAQFQLFFIVKDVSEGSRGEYLWFGVPFFDSRAEFPPAYRARDAGKDDATGKLIYTIDGREVLSKPLVRGERVAVRKDLLPAILEALRYAAKEGYLPSADPARYAVWNMNLGWEMPGAYDGAVEVRGLAVTAIVRSGSAQRPGRRPRSL